VHYVAFSVAIRPKHYTQFDTLLLSAEKLCIVSEFNWRSSVPWKFETEKPALFYHTRTVFTQCCIP